MDSENLQKDTIEEQIEDKIAEDVVSQADKENKEKDQYIKKIEEENASLKMRIQSIKEEVEKENSKIEELNKKIEEENKRIEEENAFRESENISIENKRALLEQRENDLSIMKQNLDEHQSKNQEKHIFLSKKEEELNTRELAILEKESICEQEIRTKKSELEKYIYQEKTKLEEYIHQEKTSFESKLEEDKIVKCKELDKYITDLKEQRIKELDEEIESRIKRSNESIKKEEELRFSVLDKEIKEKIAKTEKEINEKINVADEEINKKWEALNIKLDEYTKEKEALQKNLEEYEENIGEFEIEKRTIKREARLLDRKRDELDEYSDDLENRALERMQEERDTYESKLSLVRDECENLRNQLRQVNAELQKLESFKVAYGEDPSVIQKKLQDLVDKNEILEREISARPSSDLNDRYDKINAENQSLKIENQSLLEENKILNKKYEKSSILEINNNRLQSENEQLKSNLEIQEMNNRALTEELRRLKTAKEKAADREKRIEEIKSGYIQNIFAPKIANEKNEITWLEGIKRSCKDYGITFPKRILYAFHTALKISDWSSVTVLAGVSGTGKSELPRLYSAFGGLNFINVPVQPNWDSQESMLGFFNSIDNRFDSQPLLRFLVECTEDEKYKDYMSLVLLDEMNLAHVEHYFADFLSKLESRRGTKDSVPTVEVKLGAGVEPYQLALSRNVLWTGTMNQDETTKSLSDKVLDRGIVINFPRPSKLTSRKTMGSIEDMIMSLNRPMLKRETWESWLVEEINFKGDQLDEINKYKEIVEEINDILEGVGRALGHRVWQSIEHYIANYPEVLAAQREALEGELTSELKEAMRIAFEDQIVQKIMPKLRGIETRGRSGARLTSIEVILENNGFEKLKDDFDIACEQGYGQFMWSSAKYIEADFSEIQEESEESTEEV